MLEAEDIITLSNGGTSSEEQPGVDDNGTSTDGKW